MATMVANLSSHKRGWDDLWEEYSDAAVEGKQLHATLAQLVDKDTAAFNRVMDALKLPQSTEPERDLRTRAIADTTRVATEVPLRVMEVALESMDVIRRMAETGLESSVSDAGVAAICARAAIMGAHLNVQINAANLSDESFVSQALAAAERLETEATAREASILEIVRGRI